MSIRVWNVKSERDIVNQAVSNACMMMLNKSYSSLGGSSISIMSFMLFVEVISFVFDDGDDMSIDTINNILSYTMTVAWGCRSTF
jgi:hypothetical protein